MSTEVSSCPRCAHELQRSALVKHGEETCVILATIGAVLGFAVAFWGVGAIAERVLPNSDLSLFARFALGIPAIYLGTFLGVGPIAHLCDELLAPAARAESNAPSARPAVTRN